MKKYIVLLFSLLIITNISFGQSGWVWQNPLPTGNDYEMVRFYNENTGYAVGWHGTISKTTNGGNNWILANNGVMSLIGNGYYGGVLRCLYIFNSDTIIAAGNGIIKTTNGGLNWSLINTSYVEEIYFANNNTGFYISINTIYKSSDSGYNWSSITPFMGMGSWRSIYFLNLMTGFICADNGNIIKTINGGNNWNITNVGVTTSLRSILFLDANTGYCAGDKDKIFKTTDGGLNWILKFSSSYDLMGELSFSGKDTGYCCNWSGKVFKTYNGGETWDSSLVDGVATSLSSPKSNLCTVIGGGGVIYRASNSGSNWNCVSSPFGNLHFLNSITFPTNNVGYICGEKGNILKTINSGLTWFKSNSPLTVSLNDIYFLNDNTGFSVGLGGKIIFTSNGGSNWDSLQSVNSYSLQSVHFINDQTGFVSGNSHLFKTTNRGINWYSVKDDQTIFSIQFLNSTTGYCFGTYSYQGVSQTHVFKTIDQGESWYQIYFLGNAFFTKMQMVDENIGYATESNEVRKTTNGGLNWNVVFNQGGNAIYFTDQNTGYITGYKTTNAGINWYAQFVDIQPNWLIYGMFFLNSNTGFMIGGGGGSILKTTDGGGQIIGINTISNQIPKSFSLSQNYPNPFNPITKIKFDISKSSLAKIIIYDILGREVTTLMNEELKPGSYSVDWNGSNYASGIYFYRLSANPSDRLERSDGYIETKKMVLMK